MADTQSEAEVLSPVASEVTGEAGGVETQVVADPPEKQVVSPDPLVQDEIGSGTELVVDPAPAVPSLFDRLRDDHELDLSSKYENEDELVKGLANAVRAIGRRDELAELGRQYQQYAPDFNEYLQSRQASKPESKPGEVPAEVPVVEEAADPWWKAPEWDDSGNKYIKKDEHG